MLKLKTLDAFDKIQEGATFMTPFFFLDPSSQGTGMTRGGIGMTKKGGYWDDEKEALG